MARAIATAWLFADSARLPEAATERLAIVVEEWAVNIIEHGEPPSDSRIILRLARRGDHVRVIISDAGATFDPRGVETDGPNLDRGGGAGLALIQAWSRIRSYRRRAGRNRLVLELPVD